MKNCSLADFYSFFVNDNIIFHLVHETNHLSETANRNNVFSKMQELISGFDTNPNEITNFMGIIIWLGTPNE